MGFRDLGAFNLAMLAKQLWRVISQPNTLMATILKEKYYKEGNLMSVKAKRQSSFTWRSILAARDIINRGIRWRVGDGSTINVWTDKWLPTPPQHKVQTPINILPGDAKVRDLMLAETKQWNVRLIEEVFWKEEATQILNTPISKTGIEDKLMWNLTDKGTFTVKSAYHAAISLLRNSTRSSSQCNKMMPYWKLLWNLNIPNKTKNFLWRASTDSLPTKENLHTRKITKDSKCPVCLCENETLIHLLWNCPASNDVWTITSCQKWPAQMSSFDQLWQQMNDALPRPDLEKCYSIMRFLWSRRNNVIFSNQFSSPQQLLGQAVADIEEYQAARASGSKQASRPYAKWTAPRTGFAKVNWDAAVDNQNKKLGIGIMIRDCGGEVLACLSASQSFNSHPILAEGLALWRAIEFSRELGIPDIQLEGDALTLINTIKSTSACEAWYGCLVEDVKTALQQHPSWSIGFVHRESNSVAHHLAKIGLSLDIEQIWVEDFPTSLTNVISDDKA